MRQDGGDGSRCRYREPGSYARRDPAAARRLKRRNANPAKTSVDETERHGAP